MSQREVELERITRVSRPMPLGGVVSPLRIGTESFRSRRILRRTRVDPIKQFEVKKHTFLGIPTGMEGTLKVQFPNRSFFTRDVRIYVRAVSSGFKWVDRTFETTLEGRNLNEHNFHWSVGFWEMICRTFWSLVSDETTLEGWIEVDEMRREFDVTEEIPIEHAE